ncbi:nucleoid-associated protein [Ottowia sp.]|uniref:nucleoid-associated protein n=1 Tax=Ottowia sp. TaxID=1898956 RepID=UPI002B89102F|nr:nucleoid-associated protein [Ottowia sp.]HPZ57494.1 nucleoid-associated protein [Ottowia sp.]HQD48146.1 nucleoid-associated protein [Ottowia sp.]
MSIQITDAIIHQINKTAQTKDSGSVTLNARQDCLPKDELLDQLCKSLLDLYTKNANNNGTLGQDPIEHIFPLRLRSYVDGQTAFIPFTLEALNLLKTRMEGAFLSTGGYALFLRYSADAHDMLLVVMLKLKAGAGIDAETLSLTKTLNIDLSHLHEAARINVTRWLAGQQPYLTFIKGRSSANDVSEYFRDALACTGYTDSKHHTEAIIRAADEFVDSRADLDSVGKQIERIAMRQRLYDCLSSNQTEVPLATVAAAIYPNDPQDFIDHIRAKAVDGGYHVDDRFKPHKPTFQKLHRIKERFGSVQIAFDVEDVREERVKYDEQLNAVILANPPDRLKEALKENAKSAN